MCLNTFTHKGGTYMNKSFNNRYEMEKLIEEYFELTPIEEWTLSGLNIALDISKQTLFNYQKKNEYKDIIAKAKLLIEYSYELSLRKRGRAADIFAMKNFGWSDKRSISVVDAPQVTVLEKMLEQLTKEDQ